MKANVVSLLESEGAPRAKGAREVKDPIYLADGRTDDRGAAHYLGVSTACLRHWRATDEGPAYIKLPGRVWYYTPDLEQWLWSHKVVPSE